MILKICETKVGSSAKKNGG
uniref:Uncharacterized protein n=1 Tax=Anguilla anguilla TaxID=7936 RepID=A0A0E9RYG8_ANGAN